MAHTKLVPSYEEGEFTPTLDFNGSSIGITYQIDIPPFPDPQTKGYFIRIGRLVHFNIVMVLANKGSAVGPAYISGLPFAPRITHVCTFAAIAAFAAGVGAGAHFGRVNNIANGGGKIGLFEVVNGNNVPLNNTHFTNTSALRLTGTYEAEVD